MNSQIVAVYADGGVVKMNPSPIGGTWAWCHVNREGLRVEEASGGGVPAYFGLEAPVSNNVTEFYALLRGLEALPDGWRGEIYSDSGVTLKRFQEPYTTRMNGVPADLIARLRRVVDRLGTCRYHLLGGHPTRADLLSGFRAKDGKPVSVHNVWCDLRCGEEAVKLLTKLEPTLSGVA